MDTLSEDCGQFTTVKNTSTNGKINTLIKSQHLGIP